MDVLKLGASLLIASTYVAALPAHAATLTGNVLLPMCKAPDGFDWFTCAGFITGVNDAVDLHQDAKLLEETVCVPSAVKLDQMRDTVVQYLERNPQNRHQAAAGLVTLALREAFPCPAGR